LGPGKVSWTIAVFAENADEISVGVKDLDPIVESIGHIHVAILIQRNTLWCTKIAWRGELMVLAACANASQQLESVRIVDNDLILLCVHDVKQTVLSID